MDSDDDGESLFGVRRRGLSRDPQRERPDDRDRAAHKSPPSKARHKSPQSKGKHRSPPPKHGRSRDRDRGRGRDHDRDRDRDRGHDRERREGDRGRDRDADRDRDRDRGRDRDADRGRDRDADRGRDREHDGRGPERGRGGDREDGEDRGKGGGKGGKPGGRTRGTGKELPKLYSIHQAKVVSIQSYGAFVQLGDGQTYKDGLLHVSRISASGRIEAVSDVLAEGDTIYVKVIEVNEEAQKHSLDCRYVRQSNGEDLDPSNTQAETGRGAKGGGKGPEPIRIGAVQAVTCSRCGARGHMARECFAAGGTNYKLLDEVPEAPAEREKERGPNDPPWVDPKLMQAALKDYLERVGGGKKAKKKEKKEAKKAKKREKKERKKEKKEAKKAKKEAKKAKKEGKAAPAPGATGPGAGAAPAEAPSAAKGGTPAGDPAAAGGEPGEAPKPANRLWQACQAALQVEAKAASSSSSSSSSS